jgi:flagellar biogenesis protein FliO
MEALQQAVAVLFVLGLLGAALYWSRRRGFARFNVKGIGRTGNRHMQSLERLPLTPQHSLHLVSVGGRILLVAVSPNGCSVVDGSEWNIPIENGRASR